MENLLQQIMGNQSGLEEIQAELGENIFWADGSLTPVHAKRTHKAMDSSGDGEMISDSLPGDAFIFSDHTRISRKDAEQMTIGIKRYPYQEYKKGREPELFTLEDIFNKGEKRKSPAKLAERVRSKFPVIGTDPYKEIDMFDAKTDAINKQNRLPYFEGIAGLAEAEAFKEETLEDQGEVKIVPTFKRGGKVYSKHVDKAQGGTFLERLRQITENQGNLVTGQGNNGVLNDVLGFFTGDGGRGSITNLEGQLRGSNEDMLAEIEAFYQNQLLASNGLRRNQNANLNEFEGDIQNLINTSYSDNTNLLNNYIDRRFNGTNIFEGDLANLSNNLESDLAGSLASQTAGLTGQNNRLEGQLAQSNALGLGAGLFGAFSRDPNVQFTATDTSGLEALRNGPSGFQAQQRANNSNLADQLAIIKASGGDPALAQAAAFSTNNQLAANQINADRNFNLQLENQLFNADSGNNLGRDGAVNATTSNQNTIGQQAAGAFGNFANNQATNANLLANNRRNDINTLSGIENNNLASVFGVNNTNTQNLYNLRQGILGDEFTGQLSLNQFRDSQQNQLFNDVFNQQYNQDLDGFNRNFGIGETGLNSGLNQQQNLNQMLLALVSAELGVQSPFQQLAGAASAVLPGVNGLIDRIG